jgi:hypothetical protein
MARRLSPKPLSNATRGRAAARHHPVPAPPIGNTRALRSGAQADGRNLASYAETVGEVHRILAEASWIQPTDGFAVEMFARELTVFRHASAFFAARPPSHLVKMTRAQEINVARLRALNEMAKDLGLTPAGRFKLGLTQAKAEAIKVQPVRSRDHAMEVAQILADARAVPLIDTEPEAEPAPEPVTEAEVIELRVVDDEASV